MSNDTTIAAYEAHVDEYLKGSPQLVDGHVKKWLDVFLGGLNKDARILELGCGTGKDADYIDGLGYFVDRTDATQAFVFLQHERGNKARKLNALTDDFGEDLDAILADAVLLHFMDQEFRSVLQKAHKALCHSGKFAFSLKEGNGEKISDEKLGMPRYFKFWQKDDVITELKNVGFQKITVTASEDYRGPEKPNWLMFIAHKEEA